MIDVKQLDQDYKIVLTQITTISFKEIITYAIIQNFLIFLSVFFVMCNRFGMHRAFGKIVKARKLQR